MSKKTAAQLFCMAIAACSRNAPQSSSDVAPAPAPAPTPSEAQMRQTYGFAADMPADTASYTAVYQLANLFEDIRHSKTWASIKANPQMTDPATGNISMQAMMQAASPKFEEWKAILKDALGNEAFVALAPGAEAKLRAWQDLGDAMESARAKAVAAGDFKASKDPKIYAPMFASKLKDLDIPGVLIGFKITSQKAALDSELAALDPLLPPFVEKSTFQVDGQQFKSLAVTVDNMLSADEKITMKAEIAVMLADPQAAEAACQSLLARKLEIAYGYKDGYFILSIGPDHSHVKFAGSYADSLLARPEVRAAAAYAGKPLVSFTWTSGQLMGMFRRGFELAPIFETLTGDVANQGNLADITKLDAALKRIDSEGQPLFKPAVTSVMSVLYATTACAAKSTAARITGCQPAP